MRPRRAAASTTRARRVIRCGVCRSPLADAGARFRMGEGASAFVNPAGYVHEVLTVRAARNLLHAGPPTTEFTWYPGYAWEIAHCARCTSHVGWRFTPADAPADPPVFWAFRRASVVEDDTGGDGDDGEAAG